MICFFVSFVRAGPHVNVDYVSLLMFLLLLLLYLSFCCLLLLRRGYLTGNLIINLVAAAAAIADVTLCFPLLSCVTNLIV